MKLALVLKIAAQVPFGLLAAAALFMGNFQSSRIKTSPSILNSGMSFISQLYP